MLVSRTLYNWENKKRNTFTMAEYFTLTFLRCNTDYFPLELFVSKIFDADQTAVQLARVHLEFSFNWNFAWQIQTEIVKNILFVYFFFFEGTAKMQYFPLFQARNRCSDCNITYYIGMGIPFPDFYTLLCRDILSGPVKNSGPKLSVLSNLSLEAHTPPFLPWR